MKSFSVACFLPDLDLEQKLRTAAETVEGRTLLALSAPFSSESLQGARIVICQAGSLAPEMARAYVGDAYLVFVLTPDLRPEQIQAFSEAGDEVWPSPLPTGYAEKRLQILLRLQIDSEKADRTRRWLDAVMDTSPDLIWVKDTIGSHLKVNEAFCEAVGKTKAQVEGRGHYYIWDIPPDEYAKGEYVCLETEEVVLAKRERCLFEESVKCKQGLRQFKTYKAPYMDADGTLLGTVGVAQDVTRHTHTASKLSENMEAINTAHIYHWRYNPSTGVAYLGHTLAADTGLPSEVENYPEPLLERGIIHPESVETCRDMHARLRKDKGECFYDVRLNLPDGSDCWKRIKYRYLDEQDNGEFLGIGEDITDYKRMESYFTISAMHSGITTWIFDIESKSVYSIVDPLNALNLDKSTVSNIPEAFSRSQRLHVGDTPAVMELHRKVCQGEKAASAVVRWRMDGNTTWSWFKLSYTTIFNTNGQPVRAIGSALDITEQVKAEHLYSMQMAYRDSITSNALGTLLLNLTRNSISECRGQFVNTPPKTVDQLFAIVAARPCIEDKVAAAKFYNRERLLSAFYDGVTTSSLEHLHCLEEGGVGWVQANISTIKNPDSGDIEAFVHIKGIDEEKTVDACFSAAAVQDNDDLLCIRADTGKVKVLFCKSAAIPCGTELTYAAHVLERPLPRILEQERAKYLEAMRLDNVEARLERQDRYTVHISIHNEQGRMRRKRARFTWLDRKRRLVCMSVSDITDAFEAELRKNALLNKALASAKDSSKAKSAFLANMSHEIRTPLNTIIGMGQILLNKSLPPAVISDLLAIQSASTGLLAIINDVLDFSKVESGKFTLRENGYMLSSLLMDVNSLMSVRLVGRPIHFLINVNPEIPANLRGDDVRLRQILTNIIGNAVKYTEKGYIALNVDGCWLPDGNFHLEMDVSDTGIGIRKEDLALLFEQFARVDTTRNSHITGTGLGLALSRGFARMMGGDITVQSHYGQGSVFSIQVVQGVEEDEPLARIKVRGQKILVYEPDAVLAAALSRSLEQLGVGCVVVSEASDLTGYGDVTHAVLRRKNYAAVQDVLKDLCYAGNIILLLENEESAEALHLAHKQMQMPLFCMQIADVLNGENRFSDTRRLSFDNSKIVPFPGVRVLVVDDNITNLQVAKGLLAPYRMQVETATSGMEALEMVLCQRYDLIFMDHMMPGLDGVETTARIRALGDECSTVPIIALTANATLDARDNFLKQGMTDFLAKPIELSKLHRLLQTYAEPVAQKTGASGVPESATPALSSSPSQLPASIEGVDMEGALAVYGDVKLYLDLIKTYAGDMAERLPQLRLFVQDKDWENYTISVHAIKSASHSVGAHALGDAAEELEKLGAARDGEAIARLHGAFMKDLETMAERTRDFVRSFVTSSENADKAERTTFDTDLVERLRAACADMDYATVENVLEDLDAFSYQGEAQRQLERMKACCQEFDYAALDALVAKLSKD